MIGSEFSACQAYTVLYCKSLVTHAQCRPSSTGQTLRIL